MQPRAAFFFFIRKSLDSFKRFRFGLFFSKSKSKSPALPVGGLFQLMWGSTAAPPHSHYLWYAVTKYNLASQWHNSSAVKSAGHNGPRRSGLWRHHHTGHLCFGICDIIMVVSHCRLVYDIKVLCTDTTLGLFYVGCSIKSHIESLCSGFSTADIIIVVFHSSGIQHFSTCSPPTSQW